MASKITSDKLKEIFGIHECFNFGTVAHERENVFIVDLTDYKGWCEDDVNTIDPNRFETLETTCTTLQLTTSCSDDELYIKPKLDFLLESDTNCHVEYLVEHQLGDVSTDYSPEWCQAMLQTCQRNRALYAMKAAMLCSAQLSGSGLAFGSFLWRHIFHEHVIPFFSLDLEN